MLRFMYFVMKWVIRERAVRGRVDSGFHDRATEDFYEHLRQQCIDEGALKDFISY
jgi:hypothetical protein